MGTDFKTIFIPRRMGFNTIEIQDQEPIQCRFGKAHPLSQSSKSTIEMIS